MYSRSSTTTAILILSSLFQCGFSFQRRNGVAFVHGASRASTTRKNQFVVPFPDTVLKATEQDANAKADLEDDGPPELTESGLPELKGDFDWDAKFAGDADWITEDVPGKIVLDDVTLAQQVTALDKLESAWRKERLQDEYDASKKVGFVYGAELLNGRFAMFFLLTGLLTELWTGYSIPGQVEEMLRVAGVIGFDG